MARLVQISKFMSLMLRHEPAKFGLSLDAEGFTPLAEVVDALRTRFTDATAADVIAVVETNEPDKRRFTILDDDIRANYGHSLAERIAQQAATPPALLLHGSHELALGRILVEGLVPMKRQYVHMTALPDLALRVGARRGKPVLVEIDAAQAHAAGVTFYRANESFWLADSVPAQFLRRRP